MSTDLTPQRVVEILNSLLCGDQERVEYARRQITSGWYVAQAQAVLDEHAALEAALEAYKREHLRAWLEERGVSAEPSAHGLCLRIHTAGLATWDTLATADVFRCYKTAAEAYDAAAEALGYPGLEVGTMSAHDAKPTPDCDARERTERMPEGGYRAVRQLPKL